MLVKTLDGEEYEWTISEKISKGNKRKTSIGHAVAKAILKNLYPTIRIYEEVPIVVDNRQRLYLDFYIPTLKTAIEVHGKQHYEYTSLFHKSKLDFLVCQGNDRKKSEWCLINDINLIALPYNEKEELWTNRLKLLTTR